VISKAAVIRAANEFTHLTVNGLRKNIRVLSRVLNEDDYALLLLHEGLGQIPYRKKLKKVVISIKLPVFLVELLDEVAGKIGTSRSKLILEIIVLFLKEVARHGS